MASIETSKNILKAVVIFAVAVGFAASCLVQSAKTPPKITASETPEPIAVKASTKTFEAFSHKIEQHKQFECASCHQRQGRSLDMDFAGHDSCIGCHLNQFTDRTLMDRDKVMCSICHDKLQANPPTMKAFPTRFIEGFDVKFDHGDHDNGAGRPAAGCASCHQSAGPGKTIPAGFQAHNNCYGCHTAESKIGSCAVCHQLGSYQRTPQSRYVFRAVFRHDDHSERQGVSCAECHSVRPGAGQGRQVTNIVASEHDGPGNNCASCHNGSRAFGGNGADFSSCSRCHKGSGFDMLPGSPRIN